MVIHGIRVHLKRMAVALLVLGLTLAISNSAPYKVQAFTASQADQAASNFIGTFWNDAAGQFYENSDHQTHTHGGQYEDFWWAANTFEAVMDMYQRTHNGQYRSLIDSVYNGFFDANPDWQSNPFNDDIGWWALACARAYELTGDSKFLSQSKTMFDFIYSNSYSTDFGGGIWWNRNNYLPQKNVATNAPAIMTAIKLSNDLHDCSYMKKAQGLYSWLRGTFFNPNTGRLGDNISVQNGQNVVSYYDWTYNYGTFLGAALALYEKTGTSSYLTDSTTAANWAVNYLTLNGTLLYEGEDDAALFKIIFARNLNNLRVEANQQQYLKFLQDNATQAYNHMRSDGTIGPDWTFTSNASFTQVSAATAGVDILQLVPADNFTGIVTGNEEYEAENGVRHSINIENTNAGYTGRGYLAGWNSDGQWVDFHVNVATAGSYQVTLRYAAAAGDATRYIYVNGAGVINNQTFPNTGSWSSYSTVTISGLQLNAGTNTISVIFNSSLGNSNYLNLDNIIINQ